MLELFRSLLLAMIRILDVILYFSLAFLLCIDNCSLTKSSWILELYLIDEIVHMIGRKELPCVIGVAKLTSKVSHRNSFSCRLLQVPTNDNKTPKLANGFNLRTPVAFIQKETC